MSCSSLISEHHGQLDLERQRYVHAVPSLGQHLAWTTLCHHHWRLGVCTLESLSISDQFHRFHVISKSLIKGRPALSRRRPVLARKRDRPYADQVYCSYSTLLSWLLSPPCSRPIISSSRRVATRSPSCTAQVASTITAMVSIGAQPLLSLWPSDLACPA